MSWIDVRVEKLERRLGYHVYRMDQQAQRIQRFRRWLIALGVLEVLHWVVR